MADQDKTSVSRRHVVHAASAAFAAASLASSTAKGKTMAQQDLIDPVTRYPKPPFKKQSQAWPGLAGKMEPQPDHGETSYKGSGRLAGRRALSTGGDSGMGRRPRSHMRAKARTSRSTICRRRSPTRRR